MNIFDHNTSYTVGVIYQHPNLTKANKFLEDLEDFATCLNDFATKHKTVT